MLTQPI